METEESEKPHGFRSCYDKLRKAVSSIPMDAAKTAKLQNRHGPTAASRREKSVVATLFFKNNVAKVRPRPSATENLSSHRISEILPNLYLAGRTASQNSELLKEKNITTVINVSDREIPNYTHNHPFIRNYRFYPISDTAAAKFDGIIDSAIRLIHESRLRNEGVLVHCFLGVSRSATLVAFYLISAFQMKSRDAVDFVRQRRYSANPNFGFLHQLKTFSNTKAKDTWQELTSENCLRMRQSDADVIKMYLPLAVLEL